MIQRTFLGRYACKRASHTKLVWRRRSIAVGAVIAASFALDLLIGKAVQTCLSEERTLNRLNTQSFPQLLTNSTDAIVINLKLIIGWLMQNPAGLKLNSILSKA